jgi:hypothetical protein
MQLFIVFVGAALVSRSGSGENPEKSDDDAGFTAM